MEWNAPRGSLTYDLTAMKIATCKCFLLQRSAVGGSFLTPLRRFDHYRTDHDIDMTGGIVAGRSGAVA